MAKRKSLSKGTRFNIFKRDGFTCQYCGAQPPDVVLEVDHILPVCEGGDNDPMNLVTSCEDCNRGKGKKLLDKPQRPDADLAWLETQQELAELHRYATAKHQRDMIVGEIVSMLQDDWTVRSGLEWFPTEHVIRKMLVRHSPEMVEEALGQVAVKVGGGYLKSTGDDWVRYTWGILNNMAREADHAK